MGTSCYFIIAVESLGLRISFSERENAGLNVTCASRVFLLESVVHHSFELQGDNALFNHISVQR